MSTDQCGYCGQQTRPYMGSSRFCPELARSDGVSLHIPYVQNLVAEGIALLGQGAA